MQEQGPKVLTPVPFSPSAQVLEGRPFQGHRPGGEVPAGHIWYQHPQYDLSSPEVDVPPLPAPGILVSLCAQGGGRRGVEWGFKGSGAIWLLLQ
jgi:hypothetical protein